MPGAAHTPAARRFLPPSSARNAQSVRPSQLNSSSPFVRTPYPPASLRRDEIETSFEDEVEAPSSIAQAVATQRLGIDWIEDDNRDHEIRPTSIPEQSVRPDSSNLYEDDPPTKDGDPTYNPAYEFPSPLAKRQKIVHPTVVQNTSVQVSSSPPADELTGSESDMNHESDICNVAEPHFESIDEFVERTTDGTGASRAKFRLPARAVEPPSRERKRPISRGAFKDVSTARDPWLETPLPATFSPSKRKGKYDYLHGGMAETVRGWILDIAGKQEGVGAQRGTEMAVKPVLMDKSGRFELVKDGQGEMWMLIHQEDVTGRLNTQTAQGEVGSRIVTLKGNETVWQVHCPSVLKEDGKDSIYVSTLWSSS